MLSGMDKGKLSDISQHGAPQKSPTPCFSQHSTAYPQEMPVVQAQYLLTLHQQMASTLEPEAIIHSLMEWMSDIQSIDSMGYLSPTELQTITYGSTKSHSAHYTLRLDERPLGELTISRRKKFLETELQFHEIALAVAVPYLRNALDHQAVKHRAFHDSLTGAMNRTALEELLPKEILRAGRHDHPLSVIMIDIDEFKVINDNMGHIVGDLTLKKVAEHINQQLRQSDMLFRYGGDEFLIILPTTALDGAQYVGEQISYWLGSDPQEEMACIQPKLSIGMAIYQPGDDSHDLIHRADQAMYAAKISTQPVHRNSTKYFASK